MTERMQEYRKRMEEKGLVQVRVWVEKRDEEFVKFIAKFCREEREKIPKQRFGRRASENQINFARRVASAKNIPDPEHLYDYHISLCAWIRRYKGGKD